MKAVLKFNLPEDRFDFEAASKAPQYIFALQHLDEWLRGILKYEAEPLDKETIQKVRDRLHQELADEGVDLYPGE